MTTQGEHTPRLTPEDRFGVAASAQAAARANKPSSLVVAAAAIFFVACVYTALGYGEYSRAQSRADKARADYGLLQQLASDLHYSRLLEAEQRELGDVCEVNPRLISSVEEVAIAAGLDAPGTPQTPTPRSPVDGVRQMEMRYTLTHPTIEPLLRFVVDVTQQVECMKVGALQIRPTRGGEAWEVQVTFERLERVAG